VERRGVYKHEKVPLFEPDQCDEIRSSEYDLSSMIYAKSICEHFVIYPTTILLRSSQKGSSTDQSAMTRILSFDGDFRCQQRF
jgi:hypothetical protein